MGSSLRTAVALLAIGLIVAGCSGPAAPIAPTLAEGLPSPSAVVTGGSPDMEPLATASPTSTIVAITATPEPSPAQPLSRYILSVEMDYNRRLAQVDEQIVYENRTGVELIDLVLMVEPAGYPNTFDLTELTWDDGQTVEGASWEKTRLRLPLRQALPSGARVGLGLKYTLNLPTPVASEATRPVPFGATDRQTNLVDWVPFVPPYQADVGWLAHDAGYYGEHLAYETVDYEVSLRLVEDPGNLIVAASAPAQVDGEWRRYRLPAARTFALSISPFYQVATQQVGEVTVASYWFPAHAAAGERALQTTAQALQMFGEDFAPYPRAWLSVVEADFLDGMEYDGLYFLSFGFYNLYSGTPGEYLVAIAAHETAHQWWFGLVGNDQALEPWLDEALATYCERLYYEKTYPEALDWWWTYRVRYYEPRGWVDMSIYNTMKSAQPYRDYRDAVYLNGAEFLEELRQMLGDEAFLAFLKDYAAAFAGQIARRSDFFAVLSRHTSADLTPLIQKYFTP